MGQKSKKWAAFKKGLSEIFSKINEITYIYMRNDNLKKTGQLRNIWVEFGFGTVCWVFYNAFLCNTANQLSGDSWYFWAP